MSATEIRRTASLCRKAAGIATAGGHATDRLLLRLAEQLEYEADALDRRCEPSDDRPIPEIERQEERKSGID
jgi:hypothetical protein